MPLKLAAVLTDWTFTATVRLIALSHFEWVTEVCASSSDEARMVRQ
jgi:hypothetical protein